MELQATNHPVLSVDDLRVTFDPGPDEVQAVRGVSFQLASGEILGLAGRSGCGKSTVARALLGLDDRHRHEVEGRIVLRGMELGATVSPRFDQVRGTGIALVPQESMASLTPVQTIGSLVQETLRAHFDFDKEEGESRSIELLEEVGFVDAQEVAARHPHELSGGMRQRVSIALALAPKPAILVADEPTAALDSISQAQILHLIREIMERRDMSVLLITHDLSTIAGVADRVAVMEDGQILETGPVDEVFTSPRQPHTKALIEARSRTKIPRTTPAGSDPLLDMSGVHVSFEDDGFRIGRRGGSSIEALKGANLQIHAAETVALVGGSGSGKTTLARSIVALVKPTEGSIRFDGTEIAGIKRRRMRAVQQRVGFVLQDSASAFNPHHSIEESVTMPLLNVSGISRTDRTFLARAALGRVGLKDRYFERLPHELSGGERQRAGLARALVTKPDLLICDEPVSGLDGFAEMELLEIINHITEETGLACLFITHSFITARAVADRVAVMHEGEIVESGSFESVFNNPQHAHTVALVRAAGLRNGSGDGLPHVGPGGVRRLTNTSGP